MVLSKDNNTSGGTFLTQANSWWVKELLFQIGIVFAAFDCVPCNVRETGRILLIWLNMKWISEEVFEACEVLNLI